MRVSSKKINRGIAELGFKSRVIYMGTHLDGPRTSKSKVHRKCILKVYIWPEDQSEVIIATRDRLTLVQREFGPKRMLKHTPHD